MIARTRGNLLRADVEALVNPVNTVGVTETFRRYKKDRWTPEIGGTQSPYPRVKFTRLVEGGRFLSHVEIQAQEVKGVLRRSITLKVQDEQGSLVFQRTYESNISGGPFSCTERSQRACLSYVKDIDPFEIVWDGRMDSIVENGSNLDWLIFQ